jgi:phosphoinositide-3-kinase, regulatory subunit 4
MSLQNFGIPTQTIFYSRIPEDASADRASGFPPSRLHQLDNWPRRFSADTGRSVSTLDLTRSPRLGSEAGGGGGGGQAVEDLRRRLALAPSSSMTSLSSAVASTTIERRPSVQRAHDSDDAASTDSGPSPSSVPTVIRLDSGGRTPKQQRSRILQNGVDVGRVTPAVAQDMTNASGLINVEALPQYRGEYDGGSRPPSEQGTPVLGGHHAFGHGRREPRLFVPSAPKFSSTYGSDFFTPFCLLT